MAPADLRLWSVGSERLERALEPICEAVPLAPASWREVAQRSGRPAFLLVEAHPGLERSWDGELDGLLAACEDAAVPRLLWHAGAELDGAWLARCRRFTRAFDMDRGRLARLEAAGAPAPSPLWPAAASHEAAPKRPATRGAAPPVLWLGGWRPEWPAEWRERLAAVLRGAAASGLRIVADATVDGLPADLLPHLDERATPADRAAAIRDARIAIAADPVVGSVSFAPPVAFEAAGAGRAVITPHEFANVHDFGAGALRGAGQTNLMPTTTGERDTAAEIERLLADERLYEETVGHLRRIVLNNHTHEHRLATLASAAGHRMVPDAHLPAPA